MRYSPTIDSMSCSPHGPVIIAAFGSAISMLGERRIREWSDSSTGANGNDNVPPVEQDTTMTCSPINRPMARASLVSSIQSCGETSLNASFVPRP